MHIGSLLALGCVLARLGLVTCAPPTATAAAPQASQSGAESSIAPNPLINYDLIPLLDPHDHVLLPNDNDIFEELQKGVDTGMSDPSTAFDYLAYHFQPRLTIVILVQESPLILLVIPRNSSDMAIRQYRGNLALCPGSGAARGNTSSHSRLQRRQSPRPLAGLRSGRRVASSASLSLTTSPGSQPTLGALAGAFGSFIETSASAPRIATPFTNDDVPDDVVFRIAQLQTGSTDSSGHGESASVCLSDSEGTSTNPSGGHTREGTGFVNYHPEILPNTHVVPLWLLKQWADIAIEMAIKGVPGLRIADTLHLWEVLQKVSRDFVS